MATQNKPENPDTTMVKKPSGAGGQEVPHHIKDEIPQKTPPGSYRKIAVAGAGIILIIIILGVLAIYLPDILHTGSENLTATGLAGPTDRGAAMTATPGSSAGDTKPHITATHTLAITQTVRTQTPAINQAVPVTTDTSLNVTSN